MVAVMNRANGRARWTGVGRRTLPLYDPRGSWTFVRAPPLWLLVPEGC